jgi:hypothetical protein
MTGCLRHPPQPATQYQNRYPRSKSPTVAARRYQTEQGRYLLPLKYCLKGTAGGNGSGRIGPADNGHVAISINRNAIGAFVHIASKICRPYPVAIAIEFSYKCISKTPLLIG